MSESSGAKGVLLVTGGSRGIGAAVARRAAAAGHPVALFYRERRDAADAVVRDIETSGGRAVAIQADVADERSLMAAFEAADRLGRLEVLVNNAGITGGVSRLADLSAAALADVLAINVKGAFLAAREAVRRLSTAHGGQGGSIVNVSSGAAVGGSPGVWIHYAATKGAMDTLTIGLSKEVGSEGIRVNGVRPGAIDTEIHDARPPGQLDKMIQAVPMGRIGTVDEIADVVLWLCSPQASYVTGALIDARGGA